MENNCFNADSSCDELRSLSCNLTSPELRERKQTVLESLKRQILEKKEMPNGFSFRFPGNEVVLDELTEFVKTERECCPFFTFELSVSGNKSKIWLSLTGPDGVKDFITGELGL